jgi:hypothetical protein
VTKGCTIHLRRKGCQAGKSNKTSWLSNIHLHFSPNRCDRILYKSTVEPDPDEEEIFDEPPARRRSFAQMLVNGLIKPLTRSRGDSVGSLTMGSATSPLASPSGTPPVSPPISSHTTAPFSRFVSDPLTKQPVELSGLTQTVSSDYVPPRPSASLDGDVNLRRARSTSSSSKPNTSKGRRVRRSMTVSDSQSTTVPVQPHPGIGQFARRLWPSFLSQNQTSSSVTSAPELPLIQALPDIPPPPPCKGDVVCISYDTLDDAGMRRLEGRSDHRPVIGSYAVYI